MNATMQAKRRPEQPLPRTAEYGSTLAKEHPSRETELHKGLIQVGTKHYLVTFYHATAGYDLAGSCMVWKPERWGYRWFDGRAYHGLSSCDKAEAFRRFQHATNR